jgi:hypothetical protein
MSMVDRMVVVTTPDDSETRKVCHNHDVEYIISRDYSRNAADSSARDKSADGFNKGRMIERGLSILRADAWRLHLDADIVLPGQFRRLLDGAHLDTQKIYGCDRFMVRSWEQWQQLQRSGWMSHQHCNVNFPVSIDMGARWALASTGYVPIGFFQLWHGQGDEFRGRCHRPYPIHHGTACRTDVQHALQWDRRDRELLPEIVVAHLESERAVLGANWKGRTTKPFGPNRGSGSHHGVS